MARRQGEDAVYKAIDRLESEFKQRVGKDFKVWGGVFDRPTVMTLHRLLRNGLIGTLDYPVSTGKEADVFKATDDEGLDIAVKVYRFGSPSFQHLLQYVEGDPRFRSVPKDNRALVVAWAKKEYSNLERFREAGVDVPIVYAWSDNVITMEYLAREDGPAHTMKEEPPEDAQAAFDKLWADYGKLITNAQSVHADFSEYNCLMIDGVPRIIDCGQAVLLKHPMAREFLARDVHNLARYFTRQGVDLDEDALQAEAVRLFEENEAEVDPDEEEEI